MISFYSKVNSEILLFCKHNVFETAKKRINLSPDEEFLQVSILNLMSKGVEPHAHLSRANLNVKIQECWILMGGSLFVDIFDIDDSLVTNFKLSYGDVLVSFNGGHSFTSSDDALLIEIKNVPYEGTSVDYRKIDEKK